MRLTLTNMHNPTIPEIITEARANGHPPETFARLTPGEVLAVCRSRGIPVKDGRVHLNGNVADFALGCGKLR